MVAFAYGVKVRNHRIVVEILSGRKRVAAKAGGSIGGVVGSWIVVRLPEGSAARA